MKFKGTKLDLMQLVFYVSPNGRCEDAGDGLRYRTIYGGVIRWWPSTGKISVTGKRNVAEPLEEEIAEALKLWDKEGCDAFFVTHKPTTPAGPHPGLRHSRELPLNALARQR